MKKAPAAGLALACDTAGPSAVAMCYGGKLPLCWLADSKLQEKIKVLEEQLTAGSSANEELARVHAELARAKSDSKCFRSDGTPL